MLLLICHVADAREYSMPVELQQVSVVLSQPACKISFSEKTHSWSVIGRDDLLCPAP